MVIFVFFPQFDPFQMIFVMQLVILVIPLLLKRLLLAVEGWKLIFSIFSSSPGHHPISSKLCVWGFLRTNSHMEYILDCFLFKSFFFFRSKWNPWAALEMMWTNQKKHVGKIRKFHLSFWLNSIFQFVSYKQFFFPHVFWLDLFGVAKTM